MTEEVPQSQSIAGNYNAVVGRDGNATVTIVQPPLTKQWLNPLPLVLHKSFVGRQSQVDTLIEEMSQRKTIAIIGKQRTRALQGMGGIGKTYLALKVATELYDHFPGHTLRIDVGPAITDEQSAQIPLRKLASYAFGGIAPVGTLQPEQVASWLSETAPGPFLVILDDLWHVMPLRILDRALPPTAVRLVTTRFTNVAQAIDAILVPLDRLSLEDGIALLENRLHCQPGSPYHQIFVRLVQLLGGHALALEIAAAQVGKLSRVATVVQGLEQGIGQGTLSGLKLASSDERDENLERSFALSYEYMSPGQQRLFRLVGIFAEEAPITVAAAAYLWGMEDDTMAQKALYELTDLALLSETETSSGDSAIFRMHSLLRIYAQALLEHHQELTTASHAHAQFFTALSWQAISSSPQKYEILDLHTPDLLAALRWSARRDSSSLSRLIEPLGDFLRIRGQSVLLEIYLPQALAAIDPAVDGRLAANVLQSLGNLERRLGQIDDARGHYDAALPLYRAERDRLGEANVLQSLGDLESRLGQIDDARGHYDAALPLYRAERDRLGEANVLWSLGDLERRLGQIDDARGHYDAALPLYRAERAKLGEANVYMSIGDMYIALEKWTEARISYEQAQPLYVEERDPLGLANTFIDLGRAYFELGKYTQGMSYVEQSAHLFHSVQNFDWAERAEQRLAEMQARLPQHNKDEPS